MPKSKRNKVYSLTSARKKGKEQKSSLLQHVRDSCDTFDSVYVFSIENMNNSVFKELRMEWKPHSRFFFGKNKVMQLALGRTVSDEYRDNLHRVSKHLKGNTGLLFTNQTLSKVRQYFDKYSEDNYALAGMTVERDVRIPEGPLGQFSHSIEPHLRSLGLPTSLENGKVTMLQEHCVCASGDVLTPEQAKIMKLFDIKMAKFKILLKCCWKKKTCNVKLLDDSRRSCNVSSLLTDSREE